jgi:putative membrane protein
VVADTSDQPTKTTIKSIFLKEITMGMEWLKTGAFLGSIMFALMGVIIFLLTFVIIDKLTPYNLWEEIVEKQNRALALVVAAMSLGICIIVAAAIHG